MRKVGISVLLFLSAVAYGQTINPNQIRPSTTNGYVLTTVGGATVWAPGTGITFQTNSANNASQSLLNLEAGTNMTITNTSGGNVLFSSVNGTTLPPPFPVPNGQAVAWAYPTASTCGPTVASTNGFAACGPQAGIVAKYFSSPLGNCCWAATWNGFVMPTLPSDAVIQGVYGVEFVQHLFDQGTATGITHASCTSGGTQGINIPGDGINYTGEYYTPTTLGATSGIVTGASCELDIDSSLGPATLFNVNYINQVAIAIYYTTATPPPLEPYAPVVTNIQLQVGGVANGNQGLLNIAATSPITVADNGTGTVTIACPSCGGTSAVAQVTNSDGTLTISPTTGNVVASLALGHANTWTGVQTVTASGTGTAASFDVNNTSSAASTSIPTSIYLCPNLATTSLCYLNLGVANTQGNSAGLNFKYLGSNNAGNAAFISFSVNPGIQAWFNSGDVAIGSTTDAGVLFGVGSSNQLKVSSAGNLITSGGIDNSVIGATTKAAGSFTTLLASTSITDSALTSGNCVQAGTGGLLTTTGSPCGSGGSGGISGLTAGFLPLAGSSTTITANSHIDDGVTTAATLTASEPLAVTGAPGIIMAHASAASGVAGSVVYTVDPTNGYGEMNQNNAGLERIAGWNTANVFTANQTAPSWIASGSGAGSLVLTNGTAPSAVSSSVQLIAPTTVTTGYNFTFPAGAPGSTLNQMIQCSGASSALCAFAPLEVIGGSFPTGACSGNYFVNTTADGYSSYCNGSTYLNTPPGSSGLAAPLIAGQVSGNYYGYSVNNTLVAGNMLGFFADSTNTDTSVYVNVRTNGGFKVKVNNGTAIFYSSAAGIAANTFQTATIYSAAGTPIPTCNSGSHGSIGVVSDATIPTYLGTYTSGGAVEAVVECNGTNWITQ